MGIDLVKFLKEIHLRGIIHNNIKPSNICWGKFSSNIIDLEQFFIIDLGYSKINSKLVFKKEKNDTTKNFKYETLNILADTFTGTPKFMAIDFKKDRCRRNALYYIIFKNENTSLG